MTLSIQLGVEYKPLSISWCCCVALAWPSQGISVGAQAQGQSRSGERWGEGSSLERGKDGEVEALSEGYGLGERGMEREQMGTWLKVMVLERRAG